MNIGDIAFSAERRCKGWFVSDSCASLLEEKARAINVLALAPGHIAVCGHLKGDERHRLYLVPTEDPLEVVRAFSVGAAEYSGVDDHPACMRQLKKLRSRYAFTPFFADSKGLKFVFDVDLNIEIVRFLAKTVTVGITNMLADDCTITASVFDRGYVHLWWD
jgi:hypothetical protein